MLFNSYVFLFAFLPLVLAGFAVFKSRKLDRLAALWLLLASCAFYGWWNPAYLLLLLASILVNYAVALLIAAPPSGRPRRHSLLILGVTFNLALIAYFKYFGFLATNLNALAGTSFHFDILLPLAISFFTFQQIAYLVDVAKGQPAERSLPTYALFVVFFPQLIAGPIVRQEEMLPQFRSRRWRFDATQVAVGLLIFAIGLSKKVVIADGVAPVANAVFDGAERGIALTLFEAWLGALAYTVQIYFDFSGYSDMAVGLGRMFGIRLPINFDSPYKARSISEFWRRWHMTLSRFLRDYLYVPLGGNRRGETRRHVNLLITMLLGGLWHGAAWTFIVWGGLHGLYLVVNHGWRRYGDGWRIGPWWLRSLLAWLITFLAVVLAWVFFRATSLSGATTMLWAMLGGNGLSLGTGVPGSLIQVDLAVAGVVGGLLIAWLAPNIYQLLPNRLRPLETYADSARRAPPWLRWQPAWHWGIIVGIMLGLGVLGVSDENEFLYFNF